MDIDKYLEPILNKYKRNNTSPITEFILDLVLCIQYNIPKILWNNFAHAILQEDWSNYVIKINKSNSIQLCSIQQLINARAKENQNIVNFVNHGLPAHLKCPKYFVGTSMGVCVLFKILIELIQFTDYPNSDYDWCLRFIRLIIFPRESMLNTFDCEYELYSGKLYSLEDVKNLAIVNSATSWVSFYGNLNEFNLNKTWSPVNYDRNKKLYNNILDEIHMEIGMRWRMFAQKKLLRYSDK